MTVVLLCGPSLAGKSTAAQRIAQATGAAIVSADAVNATRGLPFGGEGLPESVWAETLRLKLEQLRRHIAAARPVVVDDTLCYRWLRDRFRAEAQAAGAHAELLLLAPPEPQLLARHAQVAASTQRPVLALPTLLQHLRAFEWPAPDEQAVDIKVHFDRHQDGQALECFEEALELRREKDVAELIASTELALAATSRRLALRRP